MEPNRNTWRRSWIVLVLLAGAGFAPEHSSAGDRARIAAVPLSFEAADWDRPVSGMAGFAGESLRLEWAVRSLDGVAGEIVLSLYQVAGVSVVPILKNAVLKSTARLPVGDAMVFGYDFETPEADSPKTFLARLSFAREGSATVLSNLLLRTIPKSHLSQRRGRSFLLVGFGQEGKAVSDYLGSVGLAASAVDSLPPGPVPELVLLAPGIPSAGLGEEVADIHRDLGRIIPPPEGVPALVARRATGKLVRIELPVGLVQALPWSASAQLYLDNALRLAFEDP